MTDLTEPELLAWSAPDERRERRLRQRIGDLLDHGPEARAQLPELLAAHRDPSHPVRGAVVVGEPGPAAAATLGTASVRRVAQDRPPRPVALLFPGHGAQQPRMGAQLYGSEPVFTTWMDRVFDGLGAEGDNVRADWLSDSPVIPVDAAERGQPLLFALGHALGRTILSWGLRPAALLGHSVGELAAAATAGVIDVQDAALLMTARTESYKDAASGGLLAVAAPVDRLSEFVGDGVSVGVVNGPAQTMLAGSQPALREVAERLKRAGHTAIRARIPLPFHSPLLAPLAAVSAAALTGIALRPPAVDIYSTMTARRLRPDEAVDPDFWASQVCRPVLFGPALDTLLAERDVLLVEAGPGRALTNLARRHSAVVEGRSLVVAMLPPRPGAPGSDRRAVLDTAAAIWLEGHSLDWTAVSSRGDSSSARGRPRAVPPVGDSLSTRP